MKNVVGWVKNLAVAGGFLAALFGFFIFVGIIPAPWKVWANASVPLPPQRDVASPGLELVGEQTVVVPEDVEKSLGIVQGRTRMVAAAQLPGQTQTLVLPGSTAFEPSRLYRVRARFAPARVVQLAQVVDEVRNPSGETQFRDLRAGDRVKKGDLLGVFYSVDVGNKKSDLTDAVSQRFLDEEILEKATTAFLKGALPEIFMLNAQRNVEADRGLETRAVNHLRTWDVSEKEIKACYDEAAKLSKLKGRERDLARVEINKQWPQVELRAPDDGIVVECNISQDEMIVDGTVNIFQIARVDRLMVLANAPEDSLPTLNQIMKTTDHRWNISTVGADAKVGIQGNIDAVGYLIDPNQHTVIVRGHIDNPGELLRAGQFISATVPVPPPNGVVEVPVSAVSEDGQTCIVFVQADPAKLHFTMRRVQVTHRFGTKVFVRSEAFEKGTALTPEEESLGLPPREPLRLGERVLTTAVGELKLFVQSKQSEQKKDRKDDARASK